MRRRQENGPVVALWIWIAFLAVATGVEARAAQGLSRGTLLGYAQWLQALDAGVEARLYPHGLSEIELAARGHERRLTATRALLDYDESIGRAWEAGEFEQRTQALNHARSNAEILDFDRALDWYAAAVAARGGEAGVDEILSREIFAVAIQSGDSLQVLEQLLNTVGSPRLARRTGAVVLAYRHYLGRGDVRNLDLLMEKVGTRVDALTPDIRFWHAYALVHRGRDAEALPLLLDLVREPRLGERLDRPHVEWFLRAVPDLLFLTDRRRDALRLYALLSVRDDVEAGLWARFQVAHDLLLSGRYAEAGPLLTESCDADDPAPWQLRACELAETVGTLDDIRKEGARYGTDGLHAR